MPNAFKLKNGTLLLSTEAPGGIYNSQQLKIIAELCEQDAAIVKATEDQRLALFVAPDQIETISQRLEEAGLGIRHYQDGLHQPLACLGEMCPMFEQDALGAAIDMSQELSSSVVKNPLKIGINGCNRCCVATHTLDISIVGESNGYRVSFGGKNSQLPEMASYLAEGVPAEDLSSKIAAIVKIYQENANDQESLQEVIERMGSKEFVAALAPYSQDAAGLDEFADVDVASSDSENELKLLEVEDVASENAVMENSSIEMDADSFDFKSPNDTDSLLPEIEIDAIELETPLDETNSIESESESESSPLEIENSIDTESFVEEENSLLVAEETTVPEGDFMMEADDMTIAEPTLDSDVLIAEDINSDELVDEESSETGSEMNEELADEFENKLNTEIAFAASLPEDDSIDPELRGAELEDIENHAATSDVVVQDEFSMIEDDIEETGEQMNTDTQFDLTEGIANEAFAESGLSQSKMHPIEIRKNIIVGVELLPSQLQLNMSSGLVVEIDLNELVSTGARSLNISGSKLDLKIEKNILELKSPDMKLKLPLDTKTLAAAA